MIEVAILLCSCGLGFALGVRFANWMNEYD